MHNPTQELLKEARSMFGKDGFIFQVLNIGSGLPLLPSLNQFGAAKDLGLAQGSKYYGMDSSPLEAQAYLRLDVERGTENVGMSMWNTLGMIHSHTSAYAESPRVTKDLEDFLMHIKKAGGMVTLQEIGMDIHMNPLCLLTRNQL